MTIRRVALSCILSACALAALSASLAQGARPVLLRLRLTPNAAMLYHVAAHLQTTVPMTPEPGQPPRLNRNVRNTDSVTVRTVLKAAPGGGGAVRNTVREQTVTSDGRRQRVSLPEPVVIRYDALGRVQDLDDSAEDSQPREAMRRLMGEGTAVTTICLPEKPVRPGDSWTTPFHIRGVTEHGKVTSTLVALETTGGRPTARIRSEIDVPIQSDFGIPKDVGKTIALSGHGSFHSEGSVDVANGTIVRLDVTGRVTVGASVAGGDPVLKTLFPHGISVTGDISVQMSRLPN